ncbi:hypothetical protein C7B67_03630 [filamentous cyanobacterium Phorm 6]|nr:hypothetical protein C7B67_03630 [filamentous cyanobacterium Phorm 6]
MWCCSSYSRQVTWEFVEMAVKACSEPLKSNPFITYRDPITGKWMVASQNLPTAAEQPQLAA